MLDYARFFCVLPPCLLPLLPLPPAFCFLPPASLDFLACPSQARG